MIAIYARDGRSEIRNFGGRPEWKTGEANDIRQNARHATTGEKNSNVACWQLGIVTIAGRLVDASEEPVHKE